MSDAIGRIHASEQKIVNNIKFQGKKKEKQQQWKITFKYIIGSKNLDKLANEPVNYIID